MPRKKGPESKFSRRFLRSLALEKICIQLQMAEYSTKEIAEHVRADKQYESPTYTTEAVRKTLLRAVARCKEEIGESSVEAKSRMVKRTEAAIGKCFLMVLQGDRQAMETLLKLDARYCELRGIKLFKQTTIEISGVGGGPVPVVGALEMLSHDERMKLLEQLVGKDAGPPEAGFFAGEPGATFGSTENTIDPDALP